MGGSVNVEEYFFNGGGVAWRGSRNGGLDQAVAHLPQVFLQGHLGLGIVPACGALLAGPALLAARGTPQRLGISGRHTNLCVELGRTEVHNRAEPYGPARALSTD